MRLRWSIKEWRKKKLAEKWRSVRWATIKTSDIVDKWNREYFSRGSSLSAGSANNPHPRCYAFFFFFCLAFFICLARFDVLSLSHFHFPLLRGIIVGCLWCLKSYIFPQRAAFSLFRMFSRLLFEARVKERLLRNDIILVFHLLKFHFPSFVRSYHVRSHCFKTWPLILQLLQKNVAIF